VKSEEKSQWMCPFLKSTMKRYMICSMDQCSERKQNNQIAFGGPSGDP